MRSSGARDILTVIMRILLVLFLILSISLQPVFAGVSGQQAKAVASTTQAPPDGAVGFLDVKDQERLNFRFRAGKDAELGKFPNGTFEIAFASMSRVTYGDTKHLRVGETIALTALAGAGGLLLLLSKSHTHYLTVDYTDDKGQNQMVAFEVGKDAIQPLIDSIAVRTGKKVEFEAAPGAPSQNKP